MTAYRKSPIHKGIKEIFLERIPRKMMLRKTRK